MQEITVTYKINGEERRRKIGRAHPCFIIAEAGCNHNGDLGMAKELVDEAKKAGADAIKFQTFVTEDLVTRVTPKVEYQKEGEEDKESYHDMLKGLEFNQEQWIALRKYCDEQDIIFMSTPHSPGKAVEILEALDCPMYKLGSGDLTNIPFLEDIARLGKPIIISTGMATIAETKEALEAMKNAGNEQVVVLQCTTSYPCPLEKVNLRVIRTLQRELESELIGFSDHTLSTDIPAASIAMDAVVIEKHFTLDQNLPGPDHKASLTPAGMKEMVDKVREIEQSLGMGVKDPQPIEMEIAKVARKSIIAREDIPEGSVITREMLIIKRPGTGMLPKELPNVVGKTSTQEITADTLLTPEMFQ